MTKCDDMRRYATIYDDMRRYWTILNDIGRYWTILDDNTLTRVQISVTFPKSCGDG